ncbi:hypothetical protein BSKO_01078 [Bryopsis sp. KO-2023]|nr:hypothetical protein BSKO_01078 [Bryopsis sp. KO-2023]
MKVDFQTLSGLSFQLEVSGAELIGDVKLKVLELKGIPPQRQCFTYMGRELDDERTVRSYTARPDATFVLCLKSEDETGPVLGVRKLRRAPLLSKAMGSFAEMKGWCRERVNCFGPTAATNKTCGCEEIGEQQMFEAGL